MWNTIKSWFTPKPQNQPLGCMIVLKVREEVPALGDPGNYMMMDKSVTIVSEPIDTHYLYAKWDRKETALFRLKNGSTLCIPLQDVLMLTVIPFFTQEELDAFKKEPKNRELIIYGI